MRAIAPIRRYAGGIGNEGKDDGGLHPGFVGDLVR